MRNGPIVEVLVVNDTAATLMIEATARINRVLRCVNPVASALKVSLATTLVDYASRKKNVYFQQFVA